jgi:4'-phosphopantetheinyl transferase EntD
MYELFNFKLPDFQFALLSSDAFDPGVVVVYPEEIELLKTRSNPKRKNEFLGVRHLRNQLKINSSILYHSNGRPYYAASELALSISHTKEFIALANAGFPIGIDIEQKDRDAARIINKFAREDEKVLCTGPRCHYQNTFYSRLTLRQRWSQLLLSCVVPVCCFRVTWVLSCCASVV